MPLFRLIQRKLGNLNTILQENLAGVQVVKAFAREPYELERYRTANEDLLGENLRVIRSMSSAFPAIFFVANLGTLAVIDHISVIIKIFYLNHFTSYFKWSCSD